MANSHPSVEPKSFTSALARAANSVSIVTTGGVAGVAGLTVSSVCSVCAEPPVILVCVSRDNEFCDIVAVNGVFCVNLLSSNQQDISQVFAGQSDQPEKERFLIGTWTTGLTGSPKLEGVVASLDCELTATHMHGTHNIYIGRVVNLCGTETTPLVYTMRSYAEITPISSLTQKNGTIEDTIKRHHKKTQ